MNPIALAALHLAVELLPGRWLDIPLHWQQARIGARLPESLTREVVAAARQGLVPV